MCWGLSFAGTTTACWCLWELEAQGYIPCCCSVYELRYFNIADNEAEEEE